MINLKNNDLIRYVMFKLNKGENSFKKEDIETIRDIVINLSSENVDFEEIIYFKGVNNIIISNGFVSKREIEILSNFKYLDSVDFNRCFFEDVKDVEKLNISSLGFIDCDIVNYSFVRNMVGLKSLTIINSEVSLNDFITLDKLEFLRLSNSVVKDLDKFKFPLLEELYINGTNISNYDIFEDLNKLRIIDLSRDQYDSWNEYVNNLVKRKVLILEEGIPLNSRG